MLTDPPGPPSGHAIPRTEAHLVTMSHAHPGHSSLRSVAGGPVVLSGPGEYEVQEILVTGTRTFHDDEKGALRGANTIFAIHLDDMVVCHLGDLGHVLAAGDLERIGEVDVCLLPYARLSARGPSQPRGTPAGSVKKSLPGSQKGTHV